MESKLCILNAQWSISVYRHLDNICQAVKLQLLPYLDFDEFQISQESKTVSVTGKEDVILFETIEQIMDKW